MAKPTTQENLAAELDRLEAALDKFDEHEGYIERELRHNREFNPAMWSWDELMRRIEERERRCGGQPF